MTKRLLKTSKATSPKTTRAHPPARKPRRSHDALLAELKSRLAEIGDLEGAAAILSWDQSTYMPPAGAPARGRQGALIARLLHERRTAARLGALIDALTPYAESLPADHDDAALIAVAG